MASRKKFGKCKDVNPLQKWYLILNTTATMTTAIASLTAVTVELLKFLL